MDSDETRLIQEAKRRPTAFDTLYRQHVDRIYNYVYHRVGSVEDAEDLTARTFQLALVNLPAYSDRGAPLAAWLYRIAHNLVANWHRDSSRHQTVPFDGLGGAEPVTEDGLVEWAFARETVHAALRKLEPDRQAVLVLKFSEGLSNAEIGLVLGRSEGAVKSLYHRTLLALRDALGDASSESDEAAESADRAVNMRRRDPLRQAQAAVIQEKSE
jgi:RNA polymerase sigma-70 factor, ECF subfamily